MKSSCRNINSKLYITVSLYPRAHETREDPLVSSEFRDKFISRYTRNAKFYNNLSIYGLLDLNVFPSVYGACGKLFRVSECRALMKY